ncbi:phage antirepressor KilAC domain-containing protein [Eupransor demetentiae]|uniref:KilAC domain (KilAC) n=1 Tax=Eupransor demetentiae TaxID=3109584 RepID=A0ABM9N4Q8_9LACO|nr:KilAC domain (KilAC) [Lactobacillaceae bacterium LMG 33000]
MEQIVKVQQNQEGNISVSARDLYKALGIKSSYRFSEWVTKNFNMLAEGVDYTSVVASTQVQNNGGFQTRNLVDYKLTVEAAKQIAMMSGTEKGKQVRLYFIEVEKAWNSPDRIMARAMQIAQQKLTDATTMIAQLQPKARFADAVATAKTTILIGDLAKILKQNGVEIGQNRLFAWMRGNGYLIGRKGNNYNMPTQRSMDMKLFEIKESTHTNPDGSTRITKTTKVTGKGQQYFINKFLSDKELEVAE